MTGFVATLVAWAQTPDGSQGAPRVLERGRVAERIQSGWERAMIELQDRGQTRSAMALERLWQEALGQVDEDFFMAFAGDDAWMSHGPDVLVALRRRAGVGVDVAARLEHHRRDQHPNTTAGEGWARA